MSETLPYVFQLAPDDDLVRLDPGRLAPGQALAGIERVGPIGFARRLAQLAGRPWRPAPLVVRVAAADHFLEREDDGRHWFSASRRVDRLGVARWILDAGDDLLARGVPLARLTRSGRPETVARCLLALGHLTSVFGLQQDLLQALEQRCPLPPLCVQLEGPKEELPPQTRALLDALVRGDHPVLDAPPRSPGGSPGSDLARFQSFLAGGSARGEELAGDGSLVYLQADTPWEASLGAAHWCRRHRDLPHWVGAESTLLDRGRVHQGLAPLGARRPLRGHPALLVLHFSLLLHAGPPDAELAVQQLSLPIHPIPGPLRGRLVAALRQEPTLGGPAWQCAKAEGLAALAKDRRYGAAGARRAEGWLDRLFPLEEVPITPRGLRRLVAELAPWLAGRAATALVGTEGLMAVTQVLQDLERAAFRLPPDRALARYDLLRLLELATEGVTTQDEVAETGAPPSAGGAGGLPLTPAGLLGFGLQAVSPAVAGVSWTEDEEAEFVDLTAAERTALTRDARALQVARRVLITARAPVVLVVWRSPCAEGSETHPLLHALQAWAGRSGLDRVARPARPPSGEGEDFARLGPVRTRPRATWRFTPERLPPLGTVGALERALACPLRWVLHDVAGLRPGRSARLPSARTLLAGVCRRVLQGCLREVGVPADPQSAAFQLWIGERFDQEVALRAGTLLRPGRAALQAQARRALQRTAGQVVTLLRSRGWRVAEWPVPRVRPPGAETSLEVQVDLLLQDTDGRLAVVETKLEPPHLRADWVTRLSQRARLAALGLSEEQEVLLGLLLLSSGRLLASDPALGTEPFPELEGPEAESAAFARWREAGASGQATGVGPHLGGLNGPGSPCVRCAQRALCTFSTDEEAE